MKILIKFLALLLAFMMLAACGKGKEEKSSEQEKPQQTQSQTEQEKPEEKPEEKPVSIHKERVITVDGIKNVRDLGGLVTVDGKTIKKGIILRSSELSGTNANITDAGRQFLLSNYKIKTELDVRSDKEAKKNGAIPVVGELGPSVKYVHLSAKDYYEFTKGKTNEAEILRVFADYNNYPILFHCVYGADRTGTIAYILEALVGVSDEDLIADYELTSFRKRDYSPFLFLTTAFEKRLEGIDTKDKAYRLCSNVFGLTEMEISNIRGIILTDSAVFETDSLKQPFSSSANSAVFHINMRSSKEKTRVEYNGNAVNYTFSGNTLTLSGVSLVKDTIGTITFDDGTVLSFEGA